MNSKMTEEISSLFDCFRKTMGAPIMEVEITDEQLCANLDLAVQDYAEKVQNCLWKHNGQAFMGRMCQIWIWLMHFP